MARQLKNIVIKEVSSVDRGAGDGARVMLIKRDFSAGDRKELADSGKALPDGSFPIANESDLHNAIGAIGRAKNPAEAKAHIKARAKAMGFESALPENWTKRDDNVIDMTGLLHGGVKKDGAVNFDEAQANIESRETANDMIEEVNEAICAFSCSVQSILCDEDVADKNAAIQESFAQFKSHLAGLVPEDMEKVMTPEQIKKQIDDGVAAAMTKANADHTAEIAKRDAEIAFLKMSPAEQEFAKAMSAEDKAKFAAKSKADKEKDVEDAKKRQQEDPIAKADREERETLRKRVADLDLKDQIATFGKRAVGLGLPETQGETLRKAYAGDATAITELEKVLKGLAEQVKTGKVFAEFGSSQAKTGATAYDDLMIKADELKKADPKLSKEQAFDKVFTDPANVEIKKRYDAEEIAKRRAA
jgi:hypothetical protein